MQFPGAALLVVFALTEVKGDSNITLFNIPINLTSWRISLGEAFNRNRSWTLPLRSRFSSVINGTLDFLRNGSIGCTPQGEECIPDVPSCCTSVTSGQFERVGDEDLQCLPYGGIYRCGLVTDLDDQAQQRLTALEYGDSAGMLESHPWINSWEFQSRSEAEREELQALQDEEWKKHWKPSSQENFWLKTYKKFKNEAIDIWKDLRKMKKLKEVKDSLIDKKSKRLQPTVPPVKQESPVTKKESKLFYPDELSEETDGAEEKAKTDSEESVIKFSDELPKREKKIDFRLDDIIKDAVDLASQKLKKKTKQGSQPSDKDLSMIPSLASEEEILRLEKIQRTVDKLMEEVSELKDMKKQREEREKQIEGGALNTENKISGPSIDELIRKHVQQILEEKRRLLQLKKIEEAKKSKLETE